MTPLEARADRAERAATAAEPKVVWTEAARGNVERNADWEEESTPDDIYSCAYDLAFDGAVDAGAPHDVGREIADHVARSFAQP